MPQTRADRRRNARGGASAPPPRDPMRPVYIGAVVVVAAIVIFFLVYNWQQNRALQQAVATPTPAPSATSKPIQLTDGQALGKPYFTAKIPDAPKGGLGQPVDGITCLGTEGLTLHIHAHLALFDNGKQLQIPRFVGVAPNPKLPGGACLYWIHTHFTDGIVHIEAPQISPPSGGPYTLGMFFDIWGQPLTDSNVAGLKGPVTAYVNGMKYSGDLRAIPLAAHQQIVLEVGKTVLPPNYAFPPAD
jgi:hypothetical protein